MSFDISQFADISRVFEYDYIYVDMVLLIVWLAILVWKRKYTALLFGIIIAPIIYFIDAGVWWNTVIDSGVYIREYWIDGIWIPHPAGEFALPKFGADFMMTISYALFTFPWLWILFENYYKRNKKEVIGYTTYYFGAWIFTPFISTVLNIDNTVVETVRHMGSQFDIWIINIIIAYFVLFLVYGTNIFGCKDFRKIIYVFLVGFLGSIIMEIPLYISGIRSTGITFVIFEGLILLNQGVPWLFILYDKVIPYIKKRYATMKVQN